MPRYPFTSIIHFVLFRSIRSKPTLLTWKPLANGLDDGTWFAASCAFHKRFPTKALDRGEQSDRCPTTPFDGGKWGLWMEPLQYTAGLR